jgi:phage repressor protein C with HTH and peptisase S24 domain
MQPKLKIEKVEAGTLCKLFAKHVTMSQAAFGREYGLGSPSMVNQYLKARRPLGLLAGVRFATGMGVNLRSISPRLANELEQALKVSPPTQASANQSEYARVQCVQLQLQAGKQDYKTKPMDVTGAFIAFRHDWLMQRNLDNSKLLAIQANDEGMRPTIFNGDLVVINTAARIFDDAAVFAVNYEGELRIRRLVRDAGAWWLYCDNPDTQRFPRKQFVIKHCYILGRVVHRQSEAI